MLLKYIKLTNFRQFRGIQQVDFSTDAEKNVTVILGKNTSGKTTLMQAFNWCLYSEVSFKTKVLLNKDVEELMCAGDEETVEVEILLSHKDIDYKIKKIQIYKCHSKGEVRTVDTQSSMSYLTIDGQTKIIEPYHIKDSINKILPHDLSGYFFFDGERINSISTKQDVAQSVKGLMGLDVLESTIEHLKKSRKALENNLDLVGNRNAQEAKQKIDSTAARIADIDESLKQFRQEIDYYESQKENAAQELRDNDAAAKLQQEKERLDSVIIGLQQSYTKAVNDLVKKFNKNAFAFFGKPLIERAATMLKNSDDVVASIKGINADAVKQILKMSVCICGTYIEKGSKEEKELLKQIDFMPPKSIGTLVAEFDEASSNHLSYSEDYYTDIENKYMDLRRYKKELSKKEEEREIISQSLINQKDTKALEENYQHISKTLRQKQNEEKELIAKKGGLEKDGKDCQRIFDSTVHANEKNKNINVCIAYIDEMLLWITDTYQAQESDIREKLELKINSMFSQMYHGKRSIRIDRNFKVSYDDVKTDESGGLETVKNFAFIAGLVELAKEKLISSKDGEYDLGAEPYPLVMDAPFSTADEKHVCNISRLLPTIAQQVIMVVMEKDWTFAQAELNKRVGKEYRLDKQNETYTIIRGGAQC
jgi:DNA sulfur modification protein DndD